MLESTIIAGNSGGDCSEMPVPVSGLSPGEFTSRGHNLDGDGSCGLDAPTDLPATDPQLDSLGDNGGPTLTHALQDSPAIDAIPAMACAVAVDQPGSPGPRARAATSAPSRRPTSRSR